MEKRFWAKVDKSGDCWLWVASKRAGYGAFRVDGKIFGAHCISYKMSFGEIPENMQVCHSCDNRSCVNPNHLWLGTTKDNMLDASLKGRLIREKTPVCHGTNAGYSKGCKCASCLSAHASYERSRYTPEKRKAKYREHGY